MQNPSYRLVKHLLWALVLISVHIETVYAERMKVAFINPSHPDDPFWSLMTQLMNSAATDLDIDLSVYYSARNRFKSLSLAQQIVTSETRPDYLIFHFQAQVGAKMLEAAERAEVFSLVINTQVPDADKQEVGEPRGKFKYWLGHIVPDDFAAGNLLAQALIAQWNKRNDASDNAEIHMIGLTGTYDNTASIEREVGLKSLLKQRQDVVLQQIVNADWDKKTAAQVTEVLLNRYPETKLIWCASDLMALGAIQAVEARGLKPGIDLLIGGIDGVDIGLEAVRQGKMAVSVSGHFIEAAWAMVLLYEHFQGRDFVQEQGAVLNSTMYLVDAGNVERVQSRLNLPYFEQINFKRFTGSQKGSLKHSPLQLPEQVLSTLSKQTR